MMPDRQHGGTATRWLLLSFVLLQLAVAQEPGAATAEHFSTRDTIGSRLDAVREELAALPDDASPAIRERLQQLASACQNHQSAIGLLEEARASLTRARQAEASWKGLDGDPPFPLLLLDDLRVAQAKLEASDKALGSQLRIYETEAEALRSRLNLHQQASRREQEVADGGESRPAASRSAALENLAARILAERLGRHLLYIASLKVEREDAATRKKLASLKIAEIDGRSRFSREQLDETLHRLDSERTQVALAIANENEGQSAPDPMLTWRIEFLDVSRAFWSARFALANAADPDEAREPLAAIREFGARIDDWLAIAELRLAGDDPQSDQFDSPRLREAVQDLLELQFRIRFALADATGGPTRRAATLFGKLRSSFLGIWNAELYLVEETEIVDGQKIAVYRAITTAKLARLVLIMVIGWLLLRLLGRRVRTVVARRGRMPAAAADLAGKWVFGLGLLILLLYGLHAVNIPFTVFAFLGGALAIGLGFGTQTLLKNFISGLILLFERPLRVGDVVEVAGITGTIRMIGVRASVIQHFDGIDTLVPNSLLLENQLTNWNFSNPVIRHTLRVGVSYGSPTREVNRILQSVAKEHGLVRDEPPPEVRFDNFGDNALEFTLLFWFDSQRVRRATLASDLRFMIDKAFADAGITIAFPQRDLHFPPGSSLQVELSHPTFPKGQWITPDKKADAGPAPVKDRLP